jgi:sugar lactone lactonase YvrE
MFLKFPSWGEMPAPLRLMAASAGRRMPNMRTLCILLLPILFLAQSVGCSKHHDSSNDPGTAPAITTAPSDASTVTGRQVSFTVIATGAVTLRYQWAKDGTNILGALGATYTLYSPQVQDAGHYTVTVTNPNGTITSSPVTLTVVAALTFSAPVGVAMDTSGNTFVSDMNDHTIWKVSATNQKTLLAGSSGLQGSLDGKGSNARFDTPGGVALDPSGNLLVADTGNHTIRRIAPDGTVTTLAGAAGTPGSADGVGTLARFNAPTGLAVDGTGAVYISDAQNHTIRLMALDGTVTTFAGIAGKPGQIDGARATAQFDQPNGLALAPNGTLYVADYGNSCIRAISPSGTVSLLAGQYNTHGYVDGTGTAAQFYLPVGLALDAAGVLYVADAGNHAIRKVTTAGVVNVLAGSGSSGNADGVAAAGLFFLPCGVAVSPAGNVIVADTNNHILRSITPSGSVTTYTAP